MEYIKDLIQPRFNKEVNQTKALLLLEKDFRREKIYQYAVWSETSFWR